MLAGAVNALRETRYRLFGIAFPLLPEK